MNKIYTLFHVNSSQRRKVQIISQFSLSGKKIKQVGNKINNKIHPVKRACYHLDNKMTGLLTSGQISKNTFCQTHSEWI